MKAGERRGSGPKRPDGLSVVAASIFGSRLRRRAVMAVPGAWPTPHGERRAGQDFEDGVSARALWPRGLTALADDAVTGPRPSQAREMVLLPEHNRSLPIRLAKSARRPAWTCRVMPSSDGRRQRIRCPAMRQRSSEEPTDRFDWRVLRKRTPPIRVDPADSGTTTCPRAPGKTGPPVEITACRLNKGRCFAAPPSPHDHRSRPASNAESEVPRPRSLSFLKGVSRAR